MPQYEILAKHFHPKPNAARDWARLAKRAGQKYMVMTTKHHEGFCHWDTKLTDYNATKQGPGRDLVREYVEAARAEGLRVGFYYSLMDWHHPDGAICKTDEAARRRFVDYTHGLIRELMTNYGKIDILWYDVDWPLTAEEWESERMNEMVFELQPDIIVNNRNGLPGDFSTPEQHIQAAEAGRAWETCMTLNDSWGFNRGDDAWKTPKTIVDNLATCARGGGNYLLNIGPMNPTAPFRRETDDRSRRSGQVARHQRQGHLRHRARQSLAATSTPTTRAAATRSIFISTSGPATRRRPSGSISTSPKWWSPSADSSPRRSPRACSRPAQKVEFTQDEFSLRLTGLPLEAPDQPATVIEVECDGEPSRRSRSRSPAVAALQSRHQRLEGRNQRVVCDLPRNWVPHSNHGSRE